MTVNWSPSDVRLREHVLEELVGTWKNARIIRQTNVGPSVTTNRGLREAKYALVKLVDGDDVLLPDATAQLLIALQRHPDAALAYGQSATYADAEDALARIGQARATEQPPERIEQALKPLLRECYLGPSNCLIRTALARAVAGCDERIFVQDYSLLLRLSLKGEFVATGIPVVLHPRAPEGRLNDGGDEVKRLCGWVLENLGDGVWGESDGFRKCSTHPTQGRFRQTEHGRISSNAETRGEAASRESLMRPDLSPARGER